MSAAMSSSVRVHWARPSLTYNGVTSLRSPSLRLGQRKISHEGQDRSINGSQRHNAVRLGADGGVCRDAAVERDLVLSAISISDDGCPCRKQISSGNTPKRRYFRSAALKPTRTSRVCLSLRGRGRKRHCRSERVRAATPLALWWQRPKVKLTIIQIA
jgi:hypothetical protein